MITAVNRPIIDIGPDSRLCYAPRSAMKHYASFYKHRQRAENALSKALVEAIRAGQTVPTNTCGYDTEWLIAARGVMRRDVRVETLRRFRAMTAAET